MRKAVERIVLTVALCACGFIVSCAKSEAQTAAPAPETGDPGAKVTFIELGSVSCIPCRAMQPIMEELRQRYPADLRVVFHDVWTDQGKPNIAKYRVRVIPTQVFLDATGQEFHRHEGFYPLEELEQVLRAQGVSR